jgi:hypothetical protein
MAAPSKHRPETAKRHAARADQTNWRKKLQAARLKFDDAAKERYLTVLAATGFKTRAALAAGVSCQTVGTHAENDPDFAEAMQGALEQYHARFMEHWDELVYEGTEEPIIGGKDRDEVIAHKRVYPINLIAMEARRVEPGFKERSEVDIKGGGGVLVVPANAAPDEWAKIVEGENANTVQPDPPEAAQ